MTSKRSETSYRSALERHAEDVQNRDPRLTGREDVKRTLTRWSHPNTQRRQRSMLVSFYDWMVEEGMRKDNPARQTRRPKAKPPKVYRLTADEARRLLLAATSQRERWVAYLGICAGPRLNEMRQLQGRHFARPGWLWISEDIAKGGRERWVPVLPDLEPIVAEITEHCDLGDYLFPAMRWANPPLNTQKVRIPGPCDDNVLWRIVGRLGERAGIPVRVGPHMLRRAFADHITRGAGVRNAQLLLGHADLGTTQLYLGQPTLDELAASVRGATFELSPAEQAANPLVGATGIEPVPGPVQALERFLRQAYESPVLREAARGIA